MSSLSKMTIEWASWWIPLAFLAFLTAWQLDFGAPLEDFFHEGEYLLSPSTLKVDAGAPLPLLVHGASNYLPPTLAAGLCDSETAIACTRAVNASLVAISALFFIACAWLLLVRRRHVKAAAFIGIAVMLLLINGSAKDPKELHQSAPSIRELFLFAELLCLMAAVRYAELAPRRAILFGACGGLVASLGLFWTYNRGMIGVALLGAFTLLTLFPRRNWTLSAVAAGMFIFGIGAMAISDPDMTANHASNILYWLRNGSPTADYASDVLHWMGNGMWSLDFTTINILITLPFVAVSIPLLTVSAWRAVFAYRQERVSEFRTGVLLLIVAGLVFIQMLQRADQQHLMFLLPYYALLLIYATPLSGVAPREPLTRRAVPGYLMNPFIILLVLIGMLDFYNPNFSFSRRLLYGSLANASHVVSGMPSDASVTAPRDERVASVLASVGQSCTYTFDNSGAYYHLSGLPPCSRYTNALYVMHEKEREVIEDLARSNVKALVWQSDRWASSMDGIPQVTRTPLLAAWLIRNFPYVYRIEGVLVRSCAPLRPQSTTERRPLPQPEVTSSTFPSLQTTTCLKPPRA